MSITERTIREKIDEMAKAVENLRRQLDEADRSRRALITTLSLFDSHWEAKDNLNVTVDELRGKTLDEAIRLFAVRP